MTVELAQTILGVKPSHDGHAIRKAYLRMRRLCDGDRFADEPREIKAEARRLLKLATAAYELLRAERKRGRSAAEPQDPAPIALVPSPSEPQAPAPLVIDLDEDERRERARLARQERWARWNEIERRAQAQRSGRGA